MQTGIDFCAGARGDRVGLRWPPAVRACPWAAGCLPGASRPPPGSGIGAPGRGARASPTPGGDPTSRPRCARAWVRPSVCSLDVSGNFQPGSERVSERGRERSTEARRAGQEEEVSPPERPGCALTASRALRAPGLPPPSPPPPSASACSRAGSSSAGRSSGPRRARPASRFSARAAAMARR